MKRNFCDSEAWADVKKEFGQLPAVELGRFEAMSTQSLGAARNHRRLQQQARRPPPQFALADRAPENHGGAAQQLAIVPVAVQENALVPDNTLCRNCRCLGKAHVPFAIESFRMASEDAHDFDVARCKQPCVDDLPLPGVVVKALLDDRPRNHFSKEFILATRRPSFDRGSVPETVVRHPHCGALCQTRAAQPVLLMQKALCRKFASYIARLKEPTKVPNYDLVMVFVSRLDDHVVMKFVAVVESVLQSGPHPAQQTFLMLDVLASDDQPVSDFDSFVGLCFTCRRADHVHQAESFRFKAHRGAFVQQTTDELTASLIAWAGNDQLPASGVEVHLLETRPSHGEHGEDDMQWIVTVVQESVVSVASAEAYPVAEVPPLADGDDDDDFIRRRAAGNRVRGDEFDCDNVIPGLQDMGDWLAADLEAILDGEAVDFVEMQSELARDGQDVEGSSASEPEDVPFDEEQPEAPAHDAIGVVDLSPNSCAWPDALDRLRHVYGRALVLSCLGLKCSESWDVIADDASLKPLGRLYLSWGTTLSAACKTVGHKNCKCLIRIEHSSYEHVESDLMKWLAFGQGVTQAVHWDSAQQLKIKHGMVVKGCR